jgi:hypothetical protein
MKRQFRTRQMDLFRLLSTCLQAPTLLQQPLRKSKCKEMYLPPSKMQSAFRIGTLGRNHTSPDAATNRGNATRAISRRQWILVHLPSQILLIQTWSNSGSRAISNVPPLGGPMIKWTSVSRLLPASVLPYTFSLLGPESWLTRVFLR